MARENLGLTVNGLPLDDGAGLWVPEHHFPGATARDARVSERWKTAPHRSVSSEVTTRKMRKKKPPTRAQLLERMKKGL